MEVQLKPEDIKKFVYGGKAFFSVKNIATGNKLIYNVEESTDGAISYVSVLIGPTYHFIGVVVAVTGIFRRTAKSKLSDTCVEVQSFEYINRQVITETFRSNILYYHLGKCGVCGKPLNSVTSLETGIGPECKKLITNV